MGIFNGVDKFFASLNNYLNYNLIFIIFIAAFLVVVLCVIISTSQAYEAKLIKAVDMFNNYFINNPQITEQNLVAFNNRMKSKRVPKQLRKQWQQYVLYREHSASHYMSFDDCVATPIRNSSFKRDVKIMNIVAYTFATLSLILNCYFSYENAFSVVLQHVLLCPVLILIINYLATIFFDIRHNAIVSDLYQNYQYFEVNIDKATQTLPEYVDYEVLFDRNEIKKGIPILYAYLQKRAELEQKELERARLRNIEHEKFNFDEAGIASSLVLERAMQEAENYIAERKKLMQDIEQINGDITQEEVNFREITKEYQRQMQVSKESFNNFKQQLEDVSSSIEANYLKKQQQQELDRQRNLEREYDTASDRHKKVLESYQNELINVENEIKKIRTVLENAMMSEFKTYSSKVYDEAYAVIEKREQEKYAKLREDMRQLEEALSAKDKELDQMYGQNESLNVQLGNLSNEYQQEINERDEILSRVSDAVSRKNRSNDANQQEMAEDYNYNYDYPNPEQMPEGEAMYGEYEDYNQPPFEDQYDPNYQQTDYDYNYNQDQTSQNYTYDEPTEQPEAPTFNYLDEAPDVPTFNYLDEELSKPSVEEPKENDEFDFSLVEDEEDEDDARKVELPNDEEQPSNLGELQGKQAAEEKEISAVQKEESTPVRKVGRPRKVVEEPTEKAEPKRRGRPRKEVSNEPIKTPGKPGRPRKVETAQEPVKKVGRPRKEDVATESAPVRHVGRPRKVVEEPTEKAEPKRRGRPRKEVSNEPIKTPGKPGRPRKVETAQEPVKKVGRPRKDDLAQPVNAAEPKRRGRPRKEDVKPTQTEDDFSDLDAYLAEIDSQIAQATAKMEQAKKVLENESKLPKDKK